MKAIKLTEKIRARLEEIYQEVLVFDQRGDAHFVEIVCIDPSFLGKNSLTKTREIFSHLKDLQDKVHAWSVKGFTPEIWTTKKLDFELQKYTHYPKN